MFRSTASLRLPRCPWNVSMCTFDSVFGCCKLLIVQVTAYTNISGCSAIAEAYDAISGWLLLFSHRIRIASRLLVFRTIDRFFFINFIWCTQTHSHALSWSFLIACKIWFYCWCGVAVDILWSMCARCALAFFLFAAENYPEQTMQCRAAQFTGLPIGKCWRVWSVEIWLAKCACLQWHVGDGHFRLLLISSFLCATCVLAHPSYN